MTRHRKSGYLQRLSTPINPTNSKGIIFMNLIKSTIAGFVLALIGFFAFGSLSAEPKSVSASTKPAPLPITCIGQAITNSATAKEAVDYLRGGIENLNGLEQDVITYARYGLVSGPLEKFGADLPGVIQGRIDNILAYEASGFSPEVAAQIAARVGSEACSAGYTCGDANSTNAGQCSGCGHKEVSPATNPKTCEHSCKMCCSHFATPASQTCLNSCTASDPC